MLKRLLRGWLLLPAVLLICCVYLAQSCSKKSSDRIGGNVKLTVIYSSDLHGNVRSCGCADRDMGGLGRRATFTTEALTGAENVIVVEAGDVFSLDLAYTQTEAELTFDAFNLMKLDVLTPGEIEFIFGLPFLKKVADGREFDVVALNLVDRGTGERIFPKPYVIREITGGVKVAVTGVIDDSIRFPGYIDQSGFELLPYEEELSKIMPELERQAEFLILLSHLGYDKSKLVAERFPQFDVIVIGHGKPIVKEEEKVGETILLATGGQGQYIGRLDLVLSKEGDFMYGKMRIIPLEDDIAIHDGIKELFSSYGVPLTDKEVGGEKGVRR
jgi:2',3'-cyclic-nucleotide 2'-phosphodiesterase (5'-nucleotidase family)